MDNGDCLTRLFFWYLTYLKDYYDRPLAVGQSNHLFELALFPSSNHDLCASFNRSEQSRLSTLVGARDKRGNIRG